MSGSCIPSSQRGSSFPNTSVTVCPAMTACPVNLSGRGTDVRKPIQTYRHGSYSSA